MKRIQDKRSFEKGECYHVDATMWYPLASKFFEKPEGDDEADYDICVRSFTIITTINLK